MLVHKGNVLGVSEYVVFVEDVLLELEEFELAGVVADFEGSSEVGSEGD